MLNKWKTLPLSSPISSETSRRSSCKRWKCSKSSGLDGPLLSASSTWFFENFRCHSNPWRKCFCDRWHWVPYSVWVVAKRTSTGLNVHKLWKANLARSHSSHFKRAWDDWEKGLKQAWDRRVEETQLDEETNLSGPTASPSSLRWHRLFLRQQKDYITARKRELWWHDCKDQSDGTERARGSWSRIAKAIANLACPRATSTSNLRPNEDHSLGKHNFTCDSIVPKVGGYARTIAISNTHAWDSQVSGICWSSFWNSTCLQRRFGNSFVPNWKGYWFESKSRTDEHGSRQSNHSSQCFYYYQLKYNWNKIPLQHRWLCWEDIQHLPYIKLEDKRYPWRISNRWHVW